MTRTFLKIIGICGTTFLVVLLFADTTDTPSVSYKKAEDPQPLSMATTSSIEAPATTSPIKTSIQATSTPKAKKVAAPIVKEKAAEKAAPVPEKSYSFPALSEDTLNTQARSALVNILCSTTGGSLRPISGSGVIIDPRGVILTNAHVAQFVLLASSQRVNLSCVVRTGSPASGTWTADVLFMPSPWVAEHAADIIKTRPLGTGEYDYALLFVTGTTGNSPLPATFPFVPIETRSITRVGDGALLAAYPAEFSGGNATQNALNASSAVTSIKQLLTFQENTVDLISLGGVVLAQSGSSGGAAVNAWGRLIGIISTTSDGATTAERDLRAITLSYVDRAIETETGLTLGEILNRDVAAQTSAFMQAKAPALAQLIIDQLPH
jgi:S1-C subfamily serine protease